ncbi:hypothetical protein AAVH_37025, partial [Aphelenchoides avenae]
QFSAGHSITQFLVDLFRQPFGASATQPDRSASMYEIGASPPGTFAEIHDAKTQYDHYRKVVCQLTMSNSNLMRENEALSRRLQQVESLLRDHVEHLNSVYYTLFRNGYSTLQFPDGDEVHLSQFRGVLLNFVHSKNGCSTGNVRKSVNDLSDIASIIKDRQTSEKTSDLSSESSISSEADDLKAAMIKCITKPKYNDIDDFLCWLNDSGSQCSSARLPARASSSVHAKSRSLEDHVNESLRIRSARTPLQRSSRVDEAVVQNPLRARSESELRAVPETSEPPSPGYSVKSSGHQTAEATKNSAPHPGRKTKSKTARLRAQSLGAAKIGFLSSRRTSGMAAATGDRQQAPRKSLANLATLRLG